jgi:hypothetical protein
MPSLDRGASYRQSRTRGVGPEAIQAAFGCRSLDSAQKQIDRSFTRAIRISQVLVLQGATAPVVAHVAHLQALLETGPARPLTFALLNDGHVSRAQDEARELCLMDGATPEEINLLEARVRREIAEGFAVLRDIHAHREQAR